MRRKAHDIGFQHLLIVLADPISSVAPPLSSVGRSCDSVIAGRPGQCRSSSNYTAPSTRCTEVISNSAIGSLAKVLLDRDYSLCPALADCRPAEFW